MSDTMDRMQQEAVRRMHEMQARSRPSAGKPQASPASPTKAPPSPPAPEGLPAIDNSTFENEKPAKDLLAGFFEDKERNLILLLILLLSSENTDSGLLLALMYLII